MAQHSTKLTWLYKALKIVFHPDAEVIRAPTDIIISRIESTVKSFNFDDINFLRL